MSYIYPHIIYYYLVRKFKLINVFSIKLTIGTITKKYEKYSTVLICPYSINGDSTCLAPNHIKVKKFTTNAQKKNLLIGLNWKPFLIPRSVKGKANIATKAPNIAITPNNLLGIDLKIA